MQTILNLLGPFIFWLLERWVQSAGKKKELQESYYAFLNAVDKSGAVKVANHLAAENALKEEQQRLLKEIEENRKESNEQDS